MFIFRILINLNQFDNNGIKLTTFEINPRYFVATSPNFMVGFGPGFGYMWTLQLGGDVEYRHGILFLGGGARYQFTQNKALGIDNNGADNWLVQLKAGINF